MVLKIWFTEYCPVSSNNISANVNKLSGVWFTSHLFSVIDCLISFFACLFDWAQCCFVHRKVIYEKALQVNKSLGESSGSVYVLLTKFLINFNTKTKPHAAKIWYRWYAVYVSVHGAIKMVTKYLETSVYKWYLFICPGLFILAKWNSMFSQIEMKALLILWFALWF